VQLNPAYQPACSSVEQKSAFTDTPILHLLLHLLQLRCMPASCCSVHIITDYGRPTGVALVEFASPQDAQAASAKDKQMMGTRYIEVFTSSRDELQRYLPRSY